VSVPNHFFFGDCLGNLKSDDGSSEQPNCFDDSLGGGAV